MGRSRWFPVARAEIGTKCLAYRDAKYVLELISCGGSNLQVVFDYPKNLGGIAAKRVNWYFGLCNVEVIDVF